MEEFFLPSEKEVYDFIHELDSDSVGYFRQNDIKGDANRRATCPIAIAVRRRFALGIEVQVEVINSVKLSGPHETYLRVWLPERLRRWRLDFDQGRYPEFER